jgi:pilus assembly protein CpaF
MFSVIISEKGGAERRESFDRTEINVGRVQGNDLMLPKGNVSKRHARLLFRDGRFIVTDLKSTNGTYVNGRKIAQATIVREGDKIYIGDFVLRIEASASMMAGQDAAGAPPVGDDPALMEAVPPSGPLIGASTSANIPIASLMSNEVARAQAQAYPPPPPLPYDSVPTPAKPLSPYDAPPPARSSATGESPSSQPSSGPEKGMRAPAPPRIEPKTGDGNQVISHFPLEHDPDEAMQYAVPGPPRVPSAARGLKAAAAVPRPSNAPVEPARAGATPVSPSLPGNVGAAGSMALERPTALSAALAPAPSGPIAPVAPPPAGLAASRPSVPPARVEPTEPAELARIAAHRAAMRALLDRVGEAVDMRHLDGGEAPDEGLSIRVERALTERAAAMRAQGEIKADIDTDAVVVEARRELLEYGPLTPFFDDDDVTEIQVVRHDYVLAMYGRRQIPSDIGFSSERALGRIIRRLCVSAGRPIASGERFVERRIHRGAQLFAVLPESLGDGHILLVRKPQRADQNIEDLVRSGAISRAMAGLLAQCIEARANILVTGAAAATPGTILGALLSAGSPTDRVIVLPGDEELTVSAPHAVAIPLTGAPDTGARAAHAAARIRPDRLVVGTFAGALAADVLDAVGAGVAGVLASACAPTLRQAVSRLTADLCASRAGLAPEVARDWLAGSFDLAIEVGRLSDGRKRVMRIAELTADGGRIAVRDVFTFAMERTAAGGAVEGSFHATGVIPSIVDEMVARGVSIDTSIFRRHGTGRPGPPLTPAGGIEGAR